MGLRRGFVILALILAHTACGPQGGAKRGIASLTGIALVKECILPNGVQDNTLTGHWAQGSFPLKVSFQTQSNWQSGEKDAVQSATSSWNTFYEATKSSSVFDANNHSTTIAEANPNCSDTDPEGGVALYKRGAWTGGASVIAATRYCSRGPVSPSCPPAGTGQFNKDCLRILYHSFIEFNYQNFFVAGSGNKFPDLQTIALHELGHVLGLDHACGALATGLPVPGCPASSDEDDLGLLTSILKPSFQFDGQGRGEQIRALSTNDQGRANCLY